MRLAILSANLGHIDPDDTVWVEQVAPGYEIDVHRWDDSSFPPRRCMSPRLQSRIAKMLGWQMAPGYDLYVWLDSSFTIKDPGAAKWMIDNLGDGDVGVFRHPHRSSIVAENEFIKKKIAEGNEYLKSRYEGELGDAEVAEIMSTPGYVDDRLLVAGIFIYRNVQRVRDAMVEWWYHTSRYHCVDQIGLPFVLWKHGVDTRILPGNYYAPKPYFRRLKHRA